MINRMTHRQTLILLGTAIMITMLTHPTNGQSTATASSTSTMIPRSSKSVDIQLCILSGVLTTQRADFQKTLLTHLQTNVLQSTDVYMESQYTTLIEGNLCYMCVYQAPNADYSSYAVKKLAALNNQLLYVPFTLGGGVNVQIPCKVDAAQWSGDDLTYLGTPFPVMWKVNDLLLWGSCLLSLLFVCMSALCCYAICTNTPPTTADPHNGVLSFKMKKTPPSPLLLQNNPDKNKNQDDKNVLKMDKKLLSTLNSSTSTTSSTKPAKLNSNTSTSSSSLSTKK